MQYLRRTFQRWIWMLSKNCQIFSIVWWMVFLQRKSFLLSYLFISVSSVHPFRKWTLKQSIQNTWVKSEESLFYIRPGTDNFTLRLLKDSPTRWLTSDQWLLCHPWWEVTGVTWCSDTNAVMMTSLGDTVSVILLTHLEVEYKVKCPHIVKLETQRIGRKWHNDLKYLVSDLNVSSGIFWYRSSA